MAGACGQQLLHNGWAATSLFVAILGGEGFGASRKSGADVVLARKQVSRDAVHLRIHSVRLCALSALPWRRGLFSLESDVSSTSSQ